MNMLEVLHDVETKLFELLKNPEQWQSLMINYHPPIVRRVWMQLPGDIRVYLHQIDPCEAEDALMHPHPWPSAIKLRSGMQEVGVGYGKGNDVPPLAARMILATGSEYEMIDPDGWHYVRPLEKPSFSLMVTGKPWDRPFDVKPERPLKPLSQFRKMELIEEFRNDYEPQFDEHGEPIPHD